MGPCQPTSLPPALIAHHLPAAFTAALGLLATSHELWTPAARRDPEGFQAERTTYRNTYRQGPTGHHGTEYVPPTVQVTAANMQALGICIQSVSSPNPYPISHHSPPCSQLADALERCPNITIISTNLKLSLTTPSPTHQQFEDLFQPLTGTYARACENLSTRLVGGVELQDSSQRVLAALDRTTFLPVVSEGE